MEKSEHSEMRAFAGAGKVSHAEELILRVSNIHLPLTLVENHSETGHKWAFFASQKA